MANIIELIARLKDEASGGLEKLGTNLRQVANIGLEPIARLSPTAASALGGLLDKAGPTGLAVAAIGGATVGAVAGLTRMALSAAENIERLDNLAQSTGLSVATLQAFERAAVESGQAADALVRPIIQLNAAIAEVNKGNFAVDKSFNQIGVSLVDLVSAGKSTEEIFQILAERLEAIQDPQAKAAAAADLFGVKGKALQAVLAEIAQDGLPAYIEKMRAAGVVTTEAANAAARAVDKMADEAGRMVAGIQAQVTGGLTIMAANVADLFKRIGSEGIGAMFQPGLIERQLDEITKLTKDKLLKGLQDAGKASTAAAEAVASAVRKVAEASVGAHAASIREIAVLQEQAAGNQTRVLQLQLDDELKKIEVKKDAALAALKQQTEGTELKAAREKAIEQEALDAIARAHADHAAKVGALQRGLASDLKSIFEGLGPGFESVIEKLKVAEAVERSGDAFRKLDEAVKLNVLSGREANDAFRQIVSNLEQMGATAQQINEVVPGSLDAVGASAERAANRVVQIGNAFAATAEAARRLSEEAHEHSLDDSLDAVGAPAAGLNDIFGLSQQQLDLLRRQVDLATSSMETFDPTLRAADEALEPLPDKLKNLGNEAAPAGFKFENLRKSVERYVGAVPAATRGTHELAGALYGAGDAAGGLGQQVAALVGSVLFAGKSFTDIAGQTQTFARQMLADLENFQLRLEVIRGGFGGGMSAGARSLADPLFEGADRLEAAGEKIADDIFRAARALGWGGAPEFFQEGGMVPGPRGAPHLAVLHGGEYVVPEEVVRRGARGLIQAPVAAAAAGGQGQVISINIVVNGFLDSGPARDQFARDMGRRIHDAVRRQIL